MGVNIVKVGTETRLDLSADTVTSEKMLAGTTAHDKTGAKITGAMPYAEVENRLNKWVLDDAVIVYPEATVTSAGYMNERSIVGDIDHGSNDIDFLRISTLSNSQYPLVLKDGKVSVGGSGDFKINAGVYAFTADDGVTIPALDIGVSEIKREFVDGGDIKITQTKGYLDEDSSLVAKNLTTFIRSGSITTTDDGRLMFTVIPNDSMYGYLDAGTGTEVSFISDLKVRTIRTGNGDISDSVGSDGDLYFDLEAT